MGSTLLSNGGDKFKFKHFQNTSPNVKVGTFIINNKFFHTAITLQHHLFCQNKKCLFHVILKISQKLFWKFETIVSGLSEPTKHKGNRKSSRGLTVESRVELQAVNEISRNFQNIWICKALSFHILESVRHYAQQTGI